jgi:hypothetical protein
MRDNCRRPIHFEGANIDVTGVFCPRLFGKGRGAFSPPGAREFQAAGKLTLPPLCAPQYQTANSQASGSVRPSRTPASACASSSGKPSLSRSRTRRGCASLRAWTRSAELDVVAMSGDDNSPLVGECKWQSRKLAPAVLDDLRRRVMRFGRLHRRQLRYALFSRSGFTGPLERRAAKEGVLLFEGAELRQV